VRRLAGHRRPEVRAIAVTGLTRSGHDAEVADWLDDPTPLVRAIARDAARRTGIDPREHYQTAVVDADPAGGAIAGLAEVGRDIDAQLLHKLLTHPAAAIRAQALRALHQLGVVPVAEVIQLLRDPSAAVVREATTALRALTRAVPEQLAWDLLADPDRVERRRAGYQLLRDRGVTRQIRAALLLIHDQDVKLSQRALADATRLAREAATPARRRLRLPPLDPTPAQFAELTDLVDSAAPLLGPETAEMLRAWLAKSTQ
jgi:hypothetical protein